VGGLHKGFTREGRGISRRNSYEKRKKIVTGEEREAYVRVEKE
jgi:hypothetical protein